MGNHESVKRLFEGGVKALNESFDAAIKTNKALWGITNAIHGAALLYTNKEFGFAADSKEAEEMATNLLKGEVESGYDGDIEPRSWGSQRNFVTEVDKRTLDEIDAIEDLGEKSAAMKKLITVLLAERHVENVADYHGAFEDLMRLESANDQPVNNKMEAQG